MQLLLLYLAPFKSKTREISCKVDSAINLALNNNNVRSHTPAREPPRSRLQCRGDKWEGLAPTCLDDEFSTFVTREQGNIHTAALHVSRILVHDGVQLGMAHCEREEGLAWAVAHERFTTDFCHHLGNSIGETQ